MSQEWKPSGRQVENKKAEAGCAEDHVSLCFQTNASELHSLESPPQVPLPVQPVILERFDKFTLHNLQTPADLGTKNATKNRFPLCP